MSATRYHRAASVADALEALAAHGDDAMIVAGGIVVGSLINQRLTLPGLLIDISRIPDLGVIEAAPDGALTLGALVTHEEVLRSSVVARCAPLLTEIAREIACVRLRNRGTLGGSLCTVGGQGDPATGLIALGATLRLCSRNGTRSLPVEEFYRDAFSTALAADELLEQVAVPPADDSCVHAFGKFGPRSAMDWTQITAAVALRRDQAGAIGSVRIGVNGLAPTPLRARATEGALDGQPADEIRWGPVLEALQQDISPDTDVVFSEGYKREVAGVLLRRTVEKALSRSGLARSAA